MRSDPTPRLLRLDAALGGLVWLGFVLAAEGGLLAAGRIERLVLLAVLVLVPGFLALLHTPTRDHRTTWSYRWLARAHLPCAALAAASFALDPGPAAAALALPWLGFAGLAAIFGLWRLLPRGVRPLEEACLDAALLYLPVGAGWLLLSRGGATPLGFQEPIVLLTAAHFHHAAFVAPSFTGLAGRALARQGPAPAAWRAAAVIVVVGPALVAAGITLSPALEAFGAWLLALGLTALALVTIARLAPRVPAAAGLLLALACAALVAAMGLAAAYGTGQVLGRAVIDIPTMVLTHANLNALGFGLGGLVAWSLLRPRARGLRPGVPFSRLRARGRVGPRYFDDAGLVPAAPLDPPRGLADSLDVYRRPDLPTDRVHPAVRAFYEDTAGHALLVRPTWRSGFRLGGRLYKAFSRRVGQMNLPLRAETRGDEVASRIVPLDAARDGRPGVRGWVRTYARTGEAVYVAAYATHVEGGQTTMDVAFPLPFSNLTSVLRLEPLGRGLRLTTLASDPPGDQGVYLVTPWLPLRLPVNETIRVWPAGAPDAAVRAPAGATVVARHDVWVLGLPALSLDYVITPVARGT
ncbi:MAG: YndJ family protein [Planctomycetes bacterium]|nr:YndJ family protein [Planctomycetota bacterium]